MIKMNKKMQFHLKNGFFQNSINIGSMVITD